MKKLCTLLPLILLQTALFAQTLTITIPEHRFRIDPYDNIIVVQRENLGEYADLSAFTEIDLQLDNFSFTFNEVPPGLEYTDSYMVNNGTADYHLFFSQLPLIKIQTNGQNLPADFYYADTDQVYVTSSGVTTMPGYLSSNPKKSYRISFWNNPEDQQPLEVSFGGMAASSTWDLISMYNDPLRIRTLVAHNLWTLMHMPGYIAQEPEAMPGAQGRYAEVFVNGHYSGIYTLAQTIDPELLDLKPFDGSIRGELYVGKEAENAVIFTGLPDYNDSLRFWAGYTMLYPQESDTTSWQNVYDFTNFVMNADSVDFNTDIWTKFDYQNYLDYFIFMNITRTSDNTGKNIFLARYDSASPYFWVPAQLNGSFGTRWDGTLLDITDDILSNGFIDRVIANNPGDYVSDVEARWAELRLNGVLQESVLMSAFANAYNLLQENNVYARESLVFPNYPFDNASYEYLTSWIQERLDFLDDYFNFIPESITKIDRETQFRIYPNPARSSFRMVSNQNLIGANYRISNVQGKIVRSGKYTGESINVGDLSRGFYIVHISDLSAKLIIR